MKRLLLAFIRGWQICVSSWMPPVCRFHPSCSRYTAQAIEVWGPWQGGWMGFKRILRCNPFHPGGEDPVPMPPDRASAHPPVIAANESERP